MKQFIVDRHTTPNTPTLEQVPTEKVPIYDTIADAESDLSNLEVGQIVKTKDAGLVANLNPIDEVKQGVFLPPTSNAVAKSLSYSTTEQKTGGKWIDGKTIYRKVIQGTSIPSGNIIGSVGNYSDVVSINGVVINNSNNDTIPINYNGQLYCAVKSNGDVSFNVGTITISKFKIVIEYTKTTD